MKGVVEIEAGRPCLDVARQLFPLEKGVVQAKKTPIHDRLDHCLEDLDGPLSQEPQRPIDESKEIVKYL